MNKHVKITIVLFFLAISLSALSFLPYLAWASGILQGISTGIIAGVVLLLVSAIKSREQSELTKACTAIHEINAALMNIIRSVGNLGTSIPQFQKGNMDFCQDLLKDTYHSCEQALHTLDESSNTLNKLILPIDKSKDKPTICNSIAEFTYFLYTKLEALKIIVLNLSEDDIDKNLILEFYNISSEAFNLYYKYTECAEEDIYCRKNRLDHSIF